MLAPTFPTPPKARYRSIEHNKIHSSILGGVSLWTVVAVDAARAMVKADDSPEAVAARKLLQMKHYQPSIGECRATSVLLSTILHQTNALYSSDQRKSLTTPGRGSTAVALCLATGGNGKRFSSSITRLPIPLADTNDEEYLSPLQCYIRKTCLEYFAADASNATSKGRQTLVSEGRVGVRCVFCKHLPRDEQAAQAVSFPNHIASILSSSVMLQCRHFPFCTEMTESVRKHIETLRKVGNNVNNAATKRRDYWSDSARSLGLFDSDAGVQVGPPRFDNNIMLSKEVSSHDAHRILPSPNFDTAWNNARTNNDNATPSMNDIPSLPESNVAGLSRSNFVSPFEPIDNPHTSITTNNDNQLMEQLVIGSTLLTMEDRDLVPDYIFLSMAQLIPNQLLAEDRIGAYRFRPIGFQGLCCRYCQGYQPGPGFGKLFPNSVRSLSQTTTTTTIIKHITSKCTHVPRHVKDFISNLVHAAEEDDKPSYALKKSDDGRPKYGSRKEFFQRLWDRLHGHATTVATSSGIIEFDSRAIITASPRFCVPINAVILPNSGSSSQSPIVRPSPINHNITNSMDDSCIESIIDNDEHNNRGTICGISLELNNIKKRHSSAFTTVSTSRKKPKA